MTFLHTVRHFLLHKLLEINEYSIHSPLLYQFYTEVIVAARKAPHLPEIEKIREELKKENRRIALNTPGAPSRLRLNERHKLSKIAGKGLTRPGYARILNRLATHFQSRKVVELGTSLGLTTLYLAAPGPVKKVWTLEGNDILANIAEKNFARVNARKIELIRGNIEQSLPPLLQKITPVDLFFIDANHTYNATTTWYEWFRSHLPEKGVVVFDDIYWSEEMTRAWRAICKKNKDNLCLDLFQFGIIIHGKDMPGGYYRLSC